MEAKCVNHEIIWHRFPDGRFRGMCKRCMLWIDPVDDSSLSELDWRTCGVVELAIRNPNVSSYIEHWERRAIEAEKERDELRQWKESAVAVLETGLSLIGKMRDGQ